MALFKILRGSSDSLNSQTFHDGYCYFTTDTGLFYIDYLDGTEEKRIPISTQNSSAANALLSQDGHAYKLWVGDTINLPPEEERDPYTIYFTNDEEGGGDILAIDVGYNSENSGLGSGNVQVAIDKLAQSAKNLAGDIETIDEGLITITESIGTINGSINTINGDISGINTKISAVEGSVNSLQNNKQNTIAGSAGQYVGFNDAGQAVAKSDPVIAKTAEMTQAVGRDADGKLYASNVFDGLILKDTQTSQLYVVEIQNGSLVSYLKGGTV